MSLFSDIANLIAENKAEKEILVIKKDVFKHCRNPDDYQTSLDLLYDKIKNDTISDIISDIIRLAIVFIILLIIFKSITLSLVFLCIIVFFYSKSSRLFNKRKYSLDEYHKWYVTREKKIIVDWWDAKTPMYGKIRYYKCWCGAKKEVTFDHNGRPITDDFR